MTKFNFTLYSSVLAANITTFELGWAYSWSSSVLPKLNGQVDSQNSPLPKLISLQEESWIASFLPLGAAIGCVISGCLCDRIGRKKTLLLFVLPRLTGYLLNGFATSVEFFYFGRFFIGLGLGATFIVIPMYVGETAEVRNRGLLGCFFSLTVSSGNLFVFAFGPYLSVQVLSFATIAPALSFAFFFALVAPESPYYLAFKGTPLEVEMSLLKLRCNDVETVKKELPEISKNVKESFAKKGGLKDLFYQRGVFKALCIMIGLIVFQQLTGVNLIFSYMQSVFEQSKSGISPELSVLFVGVAQLIAAVVTTSLVDKLGRRILLLSSAGGMCLTLLSFAAYFYVRDRGCSIEPIFWLPTASIIGFVLTYTVGFGALPFTILGEMFPAHIKSSATILTIFLSLSLAFCVTTFFPLLTSIIGFTFMYGSLSFFCCVSGIFVYFCVPETKGRTLKDIQDMLEK